MRRRECLRKRSRFNHRVPITGRKMSVGHEPKTLRCSLRRHRAFFRSLGRCMQKIRYKRSKMELPCSLPQRNTPAAPTIPAVLPSFIGEWEYGASYLANLKTIQDQRCLETTTTTITHHCSKQLTTCMRCGSGSNPRTPSRGLLGENPSWDHPCALLFCMTTLDTKSHHVQETNHEEV